MAKKSNLAYLMRQEQARLFPESAPINGRGISREYKMEEGTCFAWDLYTDPDGSFQVTKWANSKGSRFPQHLHPEVECVVVLKGQILMRYSDGTEVIIKPSKGVCNLPNKKHEAYFPEDTEYLTFMVPASEDYPANHGE